MYQYRVPVGYRYRVPVSYVAPMSYRVHVPYMYCVDLHVPVLYMYVSTVDLVVDLVCRPILVGTDPAVQVISNSVRSASLPSPTAPGPGVQRELALQVHDHQPVGT